MKIFFFIILYFQAIVLFAQNSPHKKFTFSGYGESYYSYDFSNPNNSEKPNFVYNHKRHNELNANLIVAKMQYVNKKSRANLGLMTGNYAKYNLSSEPTWAQFIYEANIGIKISDKNEIWLDAGIFPSHIGFESAISADCWTLTRSLLAENSPYYESGVKMSYTSKNGKLLLATLLLNGWQKIRNPDYIKEPAFGIQTTYTPSEKIILNYSNFIGISNPNTINTFRHFHNFYLQYIPNQRFGITAGFDLGFEKRAEQKTNNWYSPVIIIRQYLNKQTKMALRGEFYNDKNEVVITTGTANGFQLFGLSSNIDYEINNKITIRFEGKMYHSKDKIFTNNTENRNYSLTTNLTMRL